MTTRFSVFYSRIIFFMQLVKMYVVILGCCIHRYWYGNCNSRLNWIQINDNKKSRKL